jgi:hypothetical protein
MFAVKYRSAFAAESAAQKATYSPEAHDKCLAAWSKGASTAKPTSADASTLRKKLLSSFERASRFVVLSDEQVAAVTETCFEALPGETAHAVALARPGLDSSVRLALTAVHRAAFAAGFASAGSDTSQAPTVPLSADLDAVGGDYPALMTKACGTSAGPGDDGATAEVQDGKTALPTVSAAVAEALLLTQQLRAALDAAVCAAAGVPSLQHGVLSRRCELLVEASDAALDAELLAEREEEDDANDGGAGRQQLGRTADPKRHLSRAVEGCIREAFRSLVKCPSHNAPAGNAEYEAWEPTGVPRFDKLSREAATVGLDLRRLELAKAVAAAEEPLLSSAAPANPTSSGDDGQREAGSASLAATPASSAAVLDAHAAAVHKLVDYELGGGSAGAARASAALTRAVSVTAPRLVAAADTEPAAVVVSNFAARLGQIALRSAASAAEAATPAAGDVEAQVCFALAAVARVDSATRGEAWWRTLEHCAWASSCRGGGQWAAPVAVALMKTWLSPELVARALGGSPASAALTCERLPSALVPFAVLVAAGARQSDDDDDDDAAPLAPCVSDALVALNATMDEAALASQADGVAVDSALINDLTSVARVLGPRQPLPVASSATSPSALVRTAGATLTSMTNPRGAIAAAKRVVPKRFDGDADASPLAAALVTVATLACGVRRAAIAWLSELASDIVHSPNESGKAWSALLDARRAAAKTAAKLRTFQDALVSALALGNAQTTPAAPPPTEASLAAVATERCVGAKSVRDEPQPQGEQAQPVTARSGPRPERTPETTVFVRGLPPTSNRAAVASAVEAALGVVAEDYAIMFRSGASPTAYVNFADAKNAQRALEGDVLAAAIGGIKVKVAPYRG